MRPDAAVGRLSVTLRTMSATKAHANTEAETNPAPVPRDVRLVSLILASMGVEDVEPAVLVQLLEFAHRTYSPRLTRAGYTTQVLQDALVYADHASSRQGGSNISIDDVQLAIQSRVNYSFTQPPPKEVRTHGTLTEDASLSLYVPQQCSFAARIESLGYPSATA